MPLFIPRTNSDDDVNLEKISAMGESPDLVSKLLDSMYNNAPEPKMANEIPDLSADTNMLPKDTISVNSDKQIENNANFTSTPILDYLFSNGIVSADIYKSTQSEITSRKVTENDYLKLQTVIDEHEIVKAKSRLYNVKYVDLSSYNITGELLHNIPVELAKKFEVVLFEIVPSTTEKEIYKVAMVDPLDLQNVNFIEAQLDKKLEVYISEESRIRSIIENKYDTDVLIKEDVNKAIEEVKDDGSFKLDEELKGENDLTNDVANAPVARIVSMILEYGIKFKASDAHIEPRENNLTIRFQ